MPFVVSINCYMFRWHRSAITEDLLKQRTQVRHTDRPHRHYQNIKTSNFQHTPSPQCSNTEHNTQRVLARVPVAELLL